MRGSLGSGAVVTLTGLPDSSQPILTWPVVDEQPVDHYNDPLGDC
jgi:hypothetical protein